MTADDLPDPPIPDVPSHTPIGLPGRATRRGATRTTVPERPVLPSLRPGDRVVLRRLPSGASRRPIEGTVDKAESDPARYLVTDDDGGRGWYSPGDLEPVTTPPPKGRGIGTTPLARGDHVIVLPAGIRDAHTGATGTVYKIRPTTSTGATPVSITLTADCPSSCSCSKRVGEEILVAEDRLEILPMPSSATTPPTLHPDDEVYLPDGTLHRVVAIHAESATGRVTSVDIEDADLTVRGVDPRLLTRRHTASSPLDRRTPTLIVTVPLTDPSERPQTVEALIDLIAERWQETGWSVDP